MKSISMELDDGGVTISHSRGDEKLRLTVVDIDGLSADVFLSDVETRAILQMIDGMVYSMRERNADEVIEF